MRNPNHQPLADSGTVTIRLNDPITDLSLVLIAELLDRLGYEMGRMDCVGHNGQHNGLHYRAECVGREVSLLVFASGANQVAYQNAIDGVPFAGQDLQYLVATHVPRSAVDPGLRSRLGRLGISRGLAVSRFGPHGRREEVRELDARLIVRCAHESVATVRRLTVAA